MNEGFAEALILSVIFIGGITIGGCAMEKDMRTQAVSHGAAYWETKSDGSTVFKWKERAK